MLYSRSHVWNPPFSFSNKSENKKREITVSFVSLTFWLFVVETWDENYEEKMEMDHKHKLIVKNKTLATASWICVIHLNRTLRDY